VTPAEFDLTAVPKGAFLPAELVDAAEKVGRIQRKIRQGRMRSGKPLCPVPGAWRTFKTCEPKLEATRTARGDEPLKGRHFYTQKKGQCPVPSDYITAVVSGSADLDQVSLKCAVLFMASCSSRIHYQRPLARRRKAAKSACVFYLTNSVPRAYHARNFLEQVFKGVDPTSRRGKKAMVKALQGVPHSGRPGVY
jgi:hypothetical protein